MTQFPSPSTSVSASSATPSTDPTSFYPHRPLKQLTAGQAKPAGPFPRPLPEQTLQNRMQREAHGHQLKESLEQIAQDWTQRQEQREFPEAPAPASMPLLVRTDPNRTTQQDCLKAVGLEVVSHLEDGYVMATPAGGKLDGFQQKIELFLNEERGGGRISGIWEVLDGRERLQYLLSPALIERWSTLSDEEWLIVDVGVACAGEPSSVSRSPLQKNEESDEQYCKRLQRWHEKRLQHLHTLDGLQYQRVRELEDFVSSYGGEILSEISGSARQADSFSARVKISGAGLRDLVFNFPYLFEVVEAPALHSPGYQVEVDPVGIAIVTGLPTAEFPPNVLDELVDRYHEQQGIRIFVLEIAHPTPASSRHMSAWAAAIDQLMAEREVLFIIRAVATSHTTELPDPAHSFQALAIGYKEQRHPGIWNTLKPDVSEGDRSILDEIRTIAAALPGQSPLLYRALLVHSTRCATPGSKPPIEQLQTNGYGNLDGQRAIANPFNRVTWITSEVQHIQARQVQVYQVRLPDLTAVGVQACKLQVEVTLAYQACPARTGRGHRDYLSIWLDWQTNRKGETPELFLQRILKGYESEEEEAAAPQKPNRFRWAIGTCQRYDRQTGALKCRSRNIGTLQKDWMQIKGTALDSTFCIAVTGHAGWDNAPDAEAAYVLVVSVETMTPSIDLHAISTQT